MLEVGIGDDGRLRVGWGEPDWFGPATWVAPDGVEQHGGRLGDDVALLTIRAGADLTDLATGDVARPCAGWHFAPADRAAGGIPERTRAFGFQLAEFCLPTQSDDRLDGWFLLPHRPQVVEPLGLVAPDGRTILLAPLDSFHDQVIGVAEPGIAWGWHGDLESVPFGFSADLAVIAAAGPRAALDRLGELLRDRYGTERPAKDRDRLGTRLSYWTDNGAAYWYRTEPGHDTPGTITATVADLRARGIPVDAVQLDSWFYPHEALRPFDTDDWVVPPTGLVRWEPREDVLPDGIPALRAALGDPPLVTHCRHLSSSSPYVDEYDCWVDADRAHPRSSALYERWFDQCQAWGVETFEHDWLVECFTGVRGLRAGVGRCREWQEGIDRAAARGITLQWCMASPADFLQTSTLTQVTSIRTSGDHGYLVGPGVLWAWFLYVNALARPLGLHPFKDVFHTDTSDPALHAEVEAMLSALSTGPVALGDPLGRADRDLALRTCRADGVLIRPDVPVAAIDATFRENPAFRPVPLVGECTTAHPAGRWTYVVAANCHDDGDAITAALDPALVGVAGDHVRWDWRAGTASTGGEWAVALGPLDWHLAVLAPTLAGGRLAVVGDPTKYATAGDRRLVDVTDGPEHVRFGVLGAGETVTVVGWSSGGGVTASTWTPAGGRADLEVTEEGDHWRVEVPVDRTGRTDVEVRAG